MQHSTSPQKAEQHQSRFDLKRPIRKAGVDLWSAARFDVQNWSHSYE
jgi:hypothetical protein